MALKLQSVDNLLIMRIGQWMRLAFLTYIHYEIGALNTGLVTKMATHIQFINVAG
jgi:hypothetical protein